MTEVRLVGAEQTRPLRQQVLRPDGPTIEDDPAAVHFAAVDGGTVLATGVLLAHPPPFAYAGAAWRLRGMATDPGRRGEGLGSAVLAAVMLHVETAGGGLLWCNARTPAKAFYERAGLRTWGEPWDDPAIGPHIVMRVELSGS